MSPNDRYEHAKTLV